MQVRKIENNTSFGINSIKFINKDAKNTFDIIYSDKSLKKIHNTIDKIKNLKPKKAPDFDIYISKVNNDHNFPELAVGYINRDGSRLLNCEIVGNQGDVIDTVYPNLNDFYKACKRVVKNVDKMFKNRG